MVGGRTLRIRAGLIALVLGLGSAGAISHSTAAVDPGGNCNDYPCYTLTVTLGGNGSGVWQSTNSSYVPDGVINCQLVNGVKAAGSVCSHEYGGTLRATPITVHYKMTPAFGSAACIGGVCQEEPYTLLLVLGVNVTLTHSFELASYPLTVSTGGTGTGSVFSTPAGISCGTTCVIYPRYGTSILLTAIAAQGSTFGGWTGACAGQPKDCLIAIIGDTSTRAAFALPPASPRTSTPPTKTPGPVKTAGPRITAGPGVTAGPGITAGPGGTAPPEDPNASPSVSEGSGETIGPSPAASGLDVAPAVAGSDVTPIALAILGAGLFIAIVLGVIGFVLIRRPGRRASP
jgi:hypothetical protein